MDHPKPFVAALLALISGAVALLYAGNVIAAVILTVLGLVLADIGYAILIHWNYPPYNFVIPAAAAVVFSAFAVVYAMLTARRYHKLEPRPFRPKHFIIYIGALAIYVALDIIFVPFGSYERMRVPTVSMENAFKVGDHMLVDKSAFQGRMPERNELVIFYPPGDNQNQLGKRCVATGGDTVQYIAKQLYINGKPASEPATVTHGDPETDSQRDFFGPIVIPGNSFFAMGDNRDNSYDSRRFGPVPADRLYGKPVRIILNLSLGRFGLKPE